MIIRKDDGTPVGSNNDLIATGTTGVFHHSQSGEDAYLDPNNNLFAQTSDLEAEASTIQTVRRAFALQRFLEREQRGGSRYIEQMLHTYGARSSDSRLQRPEYLGGNKQAVRISEVLSTAQTVDSGDNVVSPVGEMLGHGISVGGKKNIYFHAEEHGWLVGIVRLVPTPSYQQGVHKQWFRFDRFDYALPDFASIGEQAVQVKEIYSDVTSAEQEETFGYQIRYGEYKFLNDRVVGEFATDLNYWHMGRIFSSKPTLSQNFIQIDNTTVNRVFTVSNADNIYGLIRNNIYATLPLPQLSIPSI
jgi:hypothetical protein